ncbi:MAG: alkylhydroperoxidase-related (seleno)protein, partial [Pseudomonadota bacterium]
MTYFDYSTAPYPIREDIANAHRTFWQKLAGPGSWWTGTERVAIARESRNALTCAFCAERKQALSPYAVSGTHTHDGGLPYRAIDAVHRIITDQNRLTQSFVDENDANGLSKAAYVELVGVVVAVFSIDEFHRALGLPIEALPEASPGEPDRYTPAVLSDDIGFVPTIPPHGAVGKEADLCGAHASKFCASLRGSGTAHRIVVGSEGTLTGTKKKKDGVVYTLKERF